MRSAKIIILAILVVFPGWLKSTAEAVAGTNQEMVRLILYLSDEDGFTDSEGNQLNGTTIGVCKGAKVEMVFRYKGEMETVSNEEHQLDMKIKSFQKGKRPKGSWVVRRGNSINQMFKETSFSFIAGEFGEKELKVYCKAKCDGLDYMDNLSIKIMC